MPARLSLLVAVINLEVGFFQCIGHKIFPEVLPGLKILFVSPFCYLKIKRVQGLTLVISCSVFIPGLSFTVFTTELFIQYPVLP